MKDIAAKLLPFLAAGLLIIAVTSTTIAQQGTSIDLDALAARGEVLANEDPLASELRDQQQEGAGRRGFDIGMAAAEGQTEPGPGKQRIQNSLSPDEQTGYKAAVAFSLERNRYAERAKKGAAIAAEDAAVGEARNAKSDVFYKLGFDIATAIFGDPSSGAQGNTAMGPGAKGIRDSLSRAGRNGFDDSMNFNLTRRGVQLNSGSSLPPGRNGIEQGPRIGNTTPGPEYAEIRCRGYTGVSGGAFVFSTIGSRSSITGETIVTLEMAFTPADKAAGADGRGLQHYTCAFVDRAISDREPGRIRFETVADGQLRQRQHETTIDNSPTAAERFPDAQNIPQYLKDSNHYWSFFVKDTGRGYFETSSHRFWKPGPPLREKDQIKIRQP